MLIPRELIRSAPFAQALRFDLSPIQLGLGASPWHVAVASVMLCRVKRNVSVVASVFRRWQTPTLLAESDDALADALRPLGFQRQRARQLQTLSRKWDTDTWELLTDLPGVGQYVNDAVGLFCFGCTDLESSDGVLQAYAAHLREEERQRSAV